MALLRALTPVKPRQGGFLYFSKISIYTMLQEAGGSTGLLFLKVLHPLKVMGNYISNLKQKTSVLRGIIEISKILKHAPRCGTV